MDEAGADHAAVARRHVRSGSVREQREHAAALQRIHSRAALDRSLSAAVKASAAPGPASDVGRAAEELGWVQDEANTGLLKPPSRVIREELEQLQAEGAADMASKALRVRRSVKAARVSSRLLSASKKRHRREARRRRAAADPAAQTQPAATQRHDSGARTSSPTPTSPSAAVTPVSSVGTPTADSPASPASPAKRRTGAQASLAQVSRNVVLTRRVAKAAVAGVVERKWQRKLDAALVAGDDHARYAGVAV